MRAHTVILAAVALAACAARPVLPPANAVNPEDEAARIATLRTDEEQVLEVLAASDPRFAVRVGGAKESRLHSASVKALAAGDADAAIEDGALDFFSFTARGRSVEEAEAIVQRAPVIAHDANASLERELLVRLVTEARARLDAERDLPRGASALVRGVVETWRAPASRKAADTRDTRIARRLDEVRASLAGADASRVTLAELDDALDPLERIATPADFAKTAQAMARLRVALGDATMRADEGDASWPRLHAAMVAHLGVGPGADDLRSQLTEAEHALRAEATSRISRLHPDERSLAKRADALTLVSSACAESVPDSPLRALPPPPERASICGALHAVVDATDDASRLAAVIALHDDTVVALWSLALHEAHATPNHAVESAHPFFGAQPEREARLIRFAAARPVAAIAAGLAAKELAGALASDEAARWLALGDVPLDVALRTLSAGAAAAPPATTSSPSEPASPRP